MKRKCQKITKNVNAVYENSHNALKDFLKVHSYFYFSYDIFPIVICTLDYAKNDSYFFEMSQNEDAPSDIISTQCNSAFMTS